MSLNQLVVLIFKPVMGRSYLRCPSFSNFFMDEYRPVMFLTKNFADETDWLDHAYLESNPASSNSAKGSGSGRNQIQTDVHT